MRSRAWIAVAVMLAVLLVGALLAQERPGRPGMGRGRRQDMSEEERTQMWERMQERRLAGLRERLGASEEEWAVLSEPVKALQGLRRDEMRASQQLREAVRAESTTTEQLKQALEAYRKARAEIATRRKALQAQLKELVTLRQEAVLVLENILE